MNAYRNVVASLLWHIQESSTVSEDEESLERIAIEGLQEIDKAFDSYKANAVYSARFLGEIDSFVTSMNKRIQCEREYVLDRCFELVEAMSVVMRESSLTTGSLSEAEKKLCTYFEESGHWDRKDTTVIVEMYHKILPTIYEAKKKNSPSSS